MNVSEIIKQCGYETYIIIIFATYIHTTYVATCICGSFYRTSSKDKQDHDKPSYSTVTSKEDLKTATTTAATITTPLVPTTAPDIIIRYRHPQKQMILAQVIQHALYSKKLGHYINLNQSSTQVSTASTSKSSVNLAELSISAKPVVSNIKVLQSGNTNNSEKVSQAESKLIDQPTEMIKKVETESTQKITAIETEIVAQEKRLSTMAQLRDKEYAEVNQEMAKLRQNLQQNEREANQEIKTLNERLKQSKRENSTVVEGLQERLQLKENRLTALNQKIDNLQERLQEKEADTNQRVAELTSRLEQTKREASQEYTSLSERLQLKEEELTTVNQEFTAFQERTQEVEMQQRERIQMLETQLQAFCNNALPQMRQQIEAQMQQQIQQITNQLTMMQKLFNVVKPQWLISRHEIALTQNELGNGGWGRVVKATFRSKQVAAKCLHHQIISDYNIQQFVREMQISSKCHHPNLLKFLGATLEGDPIILTELMDTNLYDVIRRHELKDHQIIPLLQDIASAINYLHSLSPEPIIHRDISSSNVLLSGPVRSKWVVKLSDFGSANFLWHTSEQSRAPGNPTYAAPEVLSPHSHSEKMDVYSFGVLLFEICSGQAPSLQLRNEVLPSAAAVWPEPYRHFVPFIVSCTGDNKDERPTMSDVLAEL